MTLFQWVIPIRLTDLVEIGLFAFILYKLYSLMRGTIAVQIFLGIFVLLGIQFLVTWLDMTMLSALFGLLSDVFVLAVIVLFQPEIRRLLLVLGQNPLIRQFVSPPARDQTISEIVRAVADGDVEGSGIFAVGDDAHGAVHARPLSPGDGPDRGALGQRGARHRAAEKAAAADDQHVAESGVGRCRHGPVPWVGLVTPNVSAAPGLGRLSRLPPAWVMGLGWATGAGRRPSVRTDAPVRDRPAP